MVENIFTKDVADKVVSRINKLENDKTSLWGKMSVDQMLAHCNVTYELVYTDQHPKPGGLKKFFLKKFVKPIVTGDKPYKKGSPTAREFKIVDAKNFEEEKKRLIDHIYKTQELGEEHFQNKESHSFGKLTSQEWNTMFYKHLDHHLTQFGV